MAGLVLTRKTAESVLIGGNIRVTLEDCRPGRARLRIEAPAELSIQRDDVRREAESHDGARQVPAAQSAGE